MTSGFLRLIFLAAVLISLGACQLAPMSRPTVEERTFAVPFDEAFREVAALLQERGYRVRVSDVRAGRLEALSPIRRDAGFGEAAQQRVRVAVAEDAPGETRIVVTASMLEESDIPVHGRATYERPLRDPWYYEVFFQELAARLGP